jgi:hypothetical protein
LRTLDFLSSFDIFKRLVSFEYISLSDKQKKFLDAVVNYDKYYELTFVFVISIIKEER